MQLSVRCPGCRKSYKAPERAAGKTLTCPNCRAAMRVPLAAPIDPAAILLEGDDAPPPPSADPTPVGEEPTVPEGPPSKRRKKSKPVDLASLPPLTSNDPPFWRRHLHWLLAIALLPLVVSLLHKSEEISIVERIGDSLEKAGSGERERIVRQMEKAESLDDVLSLLPGEKLPGAFLRRSSMGHWLMAAFAAIVYMAFFMFLASDGSAKPMQVLLVGLFTATVGVGFLLLVQGLASLTEGRVLVGRSVLVILFYILKFIAFSYSAATDPDNGFLLSFVGFTLGVGLCEELVKTIPLFWHRGEGNGDRGDRAWRGLLIWGLASGAGFGIAESIMYSSRYYNGVSGPGMYVVRFFSCVALHAIWSGSVAILLYQRRDHFTGLDTWFEWIFQTLFVIAIPAALHGLYDTCLKRDMNGVALLVAFASFGYLAFLFSRLQSVDDRNANKAMLREYERRKSSMV